MFRFILIVALLVMVGCSGSGSDPTSTPTNTPTLLPSLTPTIAPSATPFPTLEPQPEVTVEPTDLIEIVVEGSEGAEVPPPINIQLPEGWDQIDGTQPVMDIQGLTAYPFTIYFGPVTGGRGVIVVMWGFSSITTGSPSAENFGQFNLGLDASRLLRLAIAVDCNVGNNPDNDTVFRIGELEAFGSNWAAVDCPEGQEDTKGWYAGTRQNGVNFAFYAFGEPIETMDGPARAELQAILDTVEFLEFIVQPGESE